MGFYIEVPEPKNKADQLVKIHGAEKLPKAPDSFFTVEGKALVVVVENPHFDAAAYCYDEKEFSRMNHSMTEAEIEQQRRETEAMGGVYMHVGPPGPRPMTWLLMEKSLVEDLSGYAETMKRRERERIS